MKLRTYLNHNWRVIGIVLLIAATGTVLILGSKAASPYATSEVEAGTLNGAGQKGDSSASAGNYVQFGAVPTDGGSGSDSGALWDLSADQMPTGPVTVPEGQPWGPWGSVEQRRPGDQVTVDRSCNMIDVIDSPVWPGQHKAYQFRSTSACGYRAELSGIAAKDFGEGDEYWFGDVLYIPAPSDIQDSQWGPHNQYGQTGQHAIMQMKQHATPPNATNFDGSPPLGFDIRDWGDDNTSGVGMVDSLCGGEFCLIPGLTIGGNAMYGRALKIEFRVKFSSNPSVGEYELWLNGVNVVPTKKKATLYPEVNRNRVGLKEGLYESQSSTNTVIWHGFKVGKTHDSVKR